MGFTELIVLGAIALLVIGPKQLPEVAKVLARMINELKRATEDLSSSVRDVKSSVDRSINDVTDSINPLNTNTPPKASPKTESHHAGSAEEVEAHGPKDPKDGESQ